MQAINSPNDYKNIYGVHAKYASLNFKELPDINLMVRSGKAASPAA